MTLTEFLMARLTEDEVWATDLVVSYTCSHSYGEAHKGCAACAITDLGTHELAQCAALRAVVELHEVQRAKRDAYRSPRSRAVEDEQAAHDRRTQEARCRVAEDTLRTLALPYADHPDYREEWKP